MNRPHFLIASGGSGGHLFPAFAVAEEIERRWPEARVMLTTGSRPIERQMCESAGREAIVLPLLASGEIWKRPLAYVRGVWNSRRVAGDLADEGRIDCAIGTGGFSMAPVVQAACRAGTPVALLEQNVIAGRATRWLAPRAEVVCASFDAMRPHLKRARIETTGNPVRASIAALASRREQHGNSLLILGGSQGARALNQGLGWIARHRPGLLTPWSVVHQTGGEESAREAAAIYRAAGIVAEVHPFIEDMAAAYSHAGLVIGRAGATTLAEVACAGTPAILVPYPFAKDRHQHANANVFAERGAAIVVEQGTDGAATGAALASALELLASEETRASMSRRMTELARPDAAARVVDVIERLIQN